MITKTEAISFLQEHQPMPKDNELSDVIINKYDEVRDFFINNPDNQCIPLFLNSFGGKNGLGVYQMIEFVITMYDKKEVLPHVLNALHSPYDSVRYWAAQIASNYPDETLVESLCNLLSEEDDDIKAATITALAQLALNNISVNMVIEVLEDEIKKITDEEIKEFAKEVLEDVRVSCKS